MASKKMKKLGKVAALLGAAYAASKMGKGNEEVSLIMTLIQKMVSLITIKNLLCWTR
jgi:hypothetical protein